MTDPRTQDTEPAENYRRVTVTGDGPVLVYGPVEISAPDGRRVRSRRPVTALCTCGLSRTSPFCDASHRRRGLSTKDPTSAQSGSQEPPTSEQPQEATPRRPDLWDA